MRSCRRASSETTRRSGTGPTTGTKNMERVFLVRNAESLPADTASVAAASDLFRGVGLEVIQALFERCPIIELAAGDSLTLADPRGECLYLVLEGRLRVHPERDGLPESASLLAGAWIGEMSVIDGFGGASRVTALCDTRLLRMDARCLWSLVASSHAAARNLFAILSRRMTAAGREPARMH
ncbi:MAG TPA: hypothetical protein DHV08_12625, partial [Rhodocyclaceae bacterium]|nr:hypothetical protein [Rhodocyclaceae bacterium]